MSTIPILQCASSLNADFRRDAENLQDGLETVIASFELMRLQPKLQLTRLATADLLQNKPERTNLLFGEKAAMPTLRPFSFSRAMSVIAKTLGQELPRPIARRGIHVRVESRVSGINAGLRPTP
ncbi:hypothetical protein [Pararhizobium sp. IMCC21322]|uniref:hypothetical protein n=1 Tax=Pararhizobium sp. IMCC21322 TaxID=3067903 RepID=UPI002741F520|nr:hypothetical protein [Pararhizobium sp. IMCC21322]